MPPLASVHRPPKERRSGDRVTREASLASTYWEEREEAARRAWAERLPGNMSDNAGGQRRGAANRNENGTNRNENGTNRNENGTKRNENGTNRNENGTNRNENGTSRNENGTNRNANGTDRNENGTNRNAKGTNRNENGTNRNENGTNRNANGTNRNANGTNRNEIGTNRNANGTDRNANGTNRNANDTNRNENGTNRNENGTNRNENGTNRNANGTDRNANGTNRNANDTNRNENGTKRNANAIELARQKTATRRTRYGSGRREGGGGGSGEGAVGGGREWRVEEEGRKIPSESVVPTVEFNGYCTGPVTGHGGDEGVEAGEMRAREGYGRMEQGGYVVSSSGRQCSRENVAQMAGSLDYISRPVNGRVSSGDKLAAQVPRGDSLEEAERGDGRCGMYVPVRQCSRESVALTTQCDCYSWSCPAECSAREMTVGENGVRVPTDHYELDGDGCLVGTGEGRGGHGEYNLHTDGGTYVEEGESGEDRVKHWRDMARERACAVTTPVRHATDACMAELTRRACHRPVRGLDDAGRGLDDTGHGLDDTGRGLDDTGRGLDYTSSVTTVPPTARDREVQPVRAGGEESPTGWQRGAGAKLGRCEGVGPPPRAAPRRRKEVSLLVLPDEEEAAYRAATSQTNSVTSVIDDQRSRHRSDGRTRDEHAGPHVTASRHSGTESPIGSQAECAEAWLRSVMPDGRSAPQKRRREGRVTSRLGGNQGATTAVREDWRPSGRYTGEQKDCIITMDDCFCAEHRQQPRRNAERSRSQATQHSARWIEPQSLVSETCGSGVKGGRGMG